MEGYAIMQTEDDLMHITNIGVNHWHDPDFFINRPGGSGDYLILLIKSRAVFTFPEGDVTAAPGNVVLYRQGTPQYYRADGERFGNDWFHFLPDSEEDLQFLKELDIACDRLLYPGNLSEPAKILEMLCHEYFFDHPHKAESITLMLRLFFIKLSEDLHCSSRGRTGTNYEKIAALRIAIYNDPSRDWSVPAIANALAMSPSSFQHTYKKYFGVSPVNDVIAARVERAKYLLSTTDHSIKQIAHICGYASDMHFVRQFGKFTGMRPTEFRNADKSGTDPYRVWST